MPRRVRVPKYCLHKRSGHARVKVHGQEIFLGTFNSPESLERYQRIVAELVASHSVPPENVHPDGLTVVEMLAAYLDHARGYYSQSDELENIKKALRPLRQLYGASLVVEFGPRSLKALRQAMIDGGLSRGLINKRVRSIVRVFRWAASEELIPPKVAEGLRSVEGLRKGFTEAREPRPVQPVADEDIEATLPHLPQTVADMVMLQRRTGARPSEVCMMTPGVIDRTGEVWIYKPAEHKTSWLGKTRKIFIGPQVQVILLPYLLRADDAYCFSPRESEAKRLAEREQQRRTPRHYGNRRGTNRQRKPRRTAGDHYTRDSYRRAIHRACNLAGVARWSPNRLRHTAATEIRRRFGLEAAQVSLGHSSADVTQVYAERDQKLAVKVALAVG